MLRRRLKAKLKGRLQTYGTIVGNVQAFGGGLDPTPVYRPVVEFFVGTQRFSFTSDTGYGQKMEEGMKTKVMYNPANPLVAFVVQDYYTPANMLLGIGGGFVGLSAMAAWMIWYSNK